MKKVISILVAAFIIIAFQVAVFAQEATFTKRYVDSNTMTYIVSATKDTSTNYVNVVISNIYKADGTASDYNYIQARVKKDSTYVSSQTRVQRGTTGSALTLNNTYGAGTTLKFYAMGNDPSLDCQITWSFSAH